MTSIELTAELADALKRLFESPTVQDTLKQDFERAKNSMAPQGFSAGAFEVQVLSHYDTDEAVRAKCLVKAPLWDNAGQNGLPEFELHALTLAGVRLEPRPNMPIRASARIFLQRTTLVYRVTSGDFTRDRALAFNSEPDVGGDIVVASGEELANFIGELFARMDGKRTSQQRELASLEMAESLAVEVEP